jgi:hypothetical protein
LSLLFLIVAIVLFLVAAFLGGVHATAGDLTLFGLVAFAAAHLPFGALIDRAR